MLPSTFLVHCACERGLAEGLSLERRVSGSAADEPLELGSETMGDLLTVAFGSQDVQIIPPDELARLPPIPIVKDLQLNLFTESRVHSPEALGQVALDRRHDVDPGAAAVLAKAAQRVAQRVFWHGMDGDDDGLQASDEHLLDLGQRRLRSRQLTLVDHLVICRQVLAGQNRRRLARTRNARDQHDLVPMRLA